MIAHRPGAFDAPELPMAGIERAALAPPEPLFMLPPMPSLRRAVPAQEPASSSAAIGALETLATAAPEATGESAAGDATPSQEPPASPAAALSQSVQLIANERRRQVEDFGHTPDKDLGKRPLALLAEIQRCVSYARDDAQYHKPGWREHCARHVAQAGAVCAAMLDYLAAGGGE